MLCEYCCPDRFTEDWYHEHPEDYPTHPATFLGQTEVDAGADSCASVHYHNEMVARGAGNRSELHTVPLDHMYGPFALAFCQSRFRPQKKHTQRPTQWRTQLHR